MEDIIAGIVISLFLFLFFPGFIILIWGIVVLNRIRNSQKEIISLLQKLPSQLKYKLEEKTGIEKKEAEPHEFIRETPSVTPPPFPAHKERPAFALKTTVPEAIKISPIKTQTSPFPPEQPARPVPERIPSEFEKNAKEIIRKIWSWIIVGEELRPKGVSMEYAVASVWLLRSAIVIILTGIGFFLKYSIENNLIDPRGRVTISIAAGLIMLITGIKLLRKKYHIIAQGLLGGGIATLYFSIFAAFSMYKIIPVFPSFLLMIFITVAAGVIAVKSDSLLISVLGVIGGYCTPIMLSTGEANFPGLFSYMLLLGIGTLGIARYKDWKLLNFLAFIFTYFIFFAAVDRFYNAAADFTIVITFLSLFFVLFSFLPILYNLFNKQKSTVLELIAMSLNIGIYFAESFYLIMNRYNNRNFVAAASVGLALFYTLQICLFLKEKVHDRNLLVIMSGFASFFITITIPLLLSDEWITTAWAVQALIFLWMSCRLRSNSIRIIAYSLYLLTFGRLFLFDFSDNFISVQAGNYWMQMLTRLMTFGLSIASVGAGYKLLVDEKKRTESVLVGPATGIDPANDIAELIPQKTAAGAFFWVGFVFLFIYLHFEFYYLSGEFYRPVQMSLLTFIWLAAMLYLILQYKRSAEKVFISVFSLFAIGLLSKLVFFDLAFWNFSVEKMLFSAAYETENALMRCLDFIPVMAVFAYAFLIFSRNAKDIRENVNPANLFAVVSLGLLFIYLTFEISSLLAFKMPGFKSGGISILWAIFAISFVLSGILKNIKPMRYAGLVLFFIIVVKVFFSDLNRLSSLYRITAFIILGLMVLSGAFLYVRFKDFFEVGINKKDGKNE